MSFRIIDTDLRIRTNGSLVAVLAECQEFRSEELVGRYILYRSTVDGDPDIFYTTDMREFGEDWEKAGSVVVKSDLFVDWKPTMLRYVDSDVDVDLFWVKTPTWDNYAPGRTYVKDSFATEVYAYEALRKNPHRGICEYHGCVVVGEHVEGIVLRRYKYTLKDAVDRDLPIDRVAVMDTITDAVAHIHSLGFVHNDLSPYNIMLDEDLKPVIIDLETCMRESAPAIIKLGTPGWSDNWKTSALVHDEIALERIGLYLNKLYDPEKQNVSPK